MQAMATSGSRWQRRSLSLLLAVAALAVCGTILGVKAAVELPAAAAVDTCSAQEMQQFSVVVVSNAPLGLRLNEKLEVLAFLADGEGRNRAVEASGLAEIGDRLVAVNDQSLETFTLEAAVEALRSAASPRILRFQTYDGRCVQPSPASMTTANSSVTNGVSAVAYQSPDGASFDYVVSSVGDKNTELKLYAVLSADGKPPSCDFRELALARPFDACKPLTFDATDKYVLVSSVFGCPMHQKAAMAEEAGAKGVIFVQRVGEKPLPVRLPPVSELPRAIRIPLAMVSIDSGTQLLEQMSTVRPDETQQLRFVFSAACAADRFSVHPEDGDPLRRSAAFLIDAASAGFLSVSVASSAETELLSDAYEFLKPADYSSAASSSGMKLPLGKHDLYFPDARIFDPCETDPMRISPLGRSRQSQMVDTFAAVRLRDPKGERGCSLMRQLVYLEAKHPAGIILGDPQFPHAASSLAAAVAVQQLKVPVVFISINAFRTIRRKLRQLQADAGEDSATHVHVEFSGANVLEHQWKELASLAVPTNWPASEAVRDRLFHRMLKDQATVDDHDLQLALVKNERYEALVASYWNAQRYYTAKVDDGTITLEEDEGIDLEEER